MAVAAVPPLLLNAQVMLADEGGIPGVEELQYDKPKAAGVRT